MDFCEHRGATVIAEFDDAKAEKLKKIKLPQDRFSLIFSQNVNNRQRKWSIKRKYGVTEHLWELNPCIDIKVPTSAIYLHISSTVCVLNAWRSMTSRSELRAQ